MKRDDLAASAWFRGTRTDAAGKGEASLLLGKDGGGNWIGPADYPHVMTIAGTRAGKSSTCLKPNLLLWPSSVLCIDPKGELAEMSATHRAAMGQNVFVLDPFGEDPPFVPTEPSLSFPFPSLLRLRITSRAASAVCAPTAVKNPLNFSLTSFCSAN